MTPEQLIPGREYTVKGYELYLPPGFGTESRKISRTFKGMFIGTINNTLYFKGFELRYSGKDKLSLGDSGITIDDICESS